MIGITCKSSLEVLSNQVSHATKNCVKQSKPVWVASDIA